METLRFLTPDQVRTVQDEFGTPVFVYDQKTLEQRAREVLAFPHAFGFTARYAMKALPTAAILRLMSDLGLHIDASSGFEADRALRAGIPAKNILITAQELPTNLKELVYKGCLFNACSLEQLRAYGALFSGNGIGIRVNPGLGSGHSNRTNVGGPSSSFGVWREHVEEALAIAREHDLRITTMHTHIGSGSDPEVWVHVAKMSLHIVEKLPDVTTLSLGGGFKIGRMAGEKSADLQRIGVQVRAEYERFAKAHGRKLHLEIEPGTYLVAEAGALVCSAVDVVNTGLTGYEFVKLDGGMTEILRPSMYGAQHPIIAVPRADQESDTESYVVVGHCCESGDILTPKKGDPEGLHPRNLAHVEPGDAIVIEGAGAYCSAMAAKNYNSFPECPEVLLTSDGGFKLIRKRQTLDQILQNEIAGG